MLTFDSKLGGWRHKETVPSGQTSAPLYTVPGNAADETYRPVSVYVAPGSGSTALVQFTPDSQAEIEANTATWFDWPNGPVTAKSFDGFVTPVTALRLTATGGSATWWALA